jgi:hypothetical protein
LKGWVHIAGTDYPMIEVEPEEMDRLKAEGDSQLWPVRFDRNRRVHPVLIGYNAEFIFKD